MSCTMNLRSRSAAPVVAPAVPSKFSILDAAMSLLSLATGPRSSTTTRSSTTPIVVAPPRSGKQYLQNKESVSIATRVKANKRAPRVNYAEPEE